MPVATATESRSHLLSGFHGQDARGYSRRMPVLNLSPARYVSGRVPVLPKAKEGFIMDPHFNEYLAAVAGLHDLYGEPPCEGCSEFHAEAAEAAAPSDAEPAVAAR
jgi:hypothetical protein